MKLIQRSRALSWLTLATMVLGCGLGVSQVHAKKDPFEFRFGLTSVGPDGAPSVYIETRVIRKYVDPSYGHGFSVRRKDRTPFMCYYRVRFPEPLKNIPPQMYDHYRITENGQVIQSEEEMHSEPHTESFFFEESDPIGHYELEVFLDGKLYRKLDYEVVAVPKIEF